jgi:ABC-type polysaccharide/polyol phosphate transport system ATPase subunit
MAFVVKAAQRMREMMDKAQLIVMVSHDLDSIKRLCHRVVWMDHGRIHSIGKPQEVVDAYKQWMNKGAQKRAA